MKNIKTYNGRTLIQLPAQALLQMLRSQVWGSLGRNENWRDLDSAGEKDAHKRTGTSCIKNGPGDLFESTGDKVTEYADGQYSGPDFLSENRRGGGTKTLQMICLPNKFGNCY